MLGEKSSPISIEQFANPKISVAIAPRGIYARLSSSFLQLYWATERLVSGAVNTWVVCKTETRSSGPRPTGSLTLAPRIHGIVLVVVTFRLRLRSLVEEILDLGVFVMDGEPGEFRVVGDVLEVRARSCLLRVANYLVHRQVCNL